MKCKKFLKESLIFIIIVIAISAIILSQGISSLDEFWQFNFAKNVSDGKIPYKDFNMVTTPLLSIICGVILKLTAKEMIITRILGIILNSSILFSIYKILEICKVNKYCNYLVLIILYAIYGTFFTIDYNFSVLLIILVLIYLEIKENNKEEKLLFYKFKYDLVIGILAGIALLFKQSVGLAVIAISALYKIILIENKQEIKKNVKIILTRILGALIPIIIFIIYLIITNSYLEFLDYAIYGLKTFNNYIPYSFLITKCSIKIKFLSIVLPISIIYTYFKFVIKEKKDFVNIILCVYSVASFVVVFPISDEMHFLVGAMPSIILLVVSIYNLHNQICSKLQKFIVEFLKIFTILIVIYVTMLNLYNIYIYISNCTKYNKVNHLKYIPNTENINNTVGEYILKMEEEGKKVYILDATSCVYTIPIDRYNKNYDMFLKGALGSKGEEGQIENLKNEEDIRVLILNKKYKLNWQTPSKVLEYIQDNWEKIGEIYIFDIYEK